MSSRSPASLAACRRMNDVFATRRKPSTSDGARAAGSIVPAAAATEGSFAAAAEPPSALPIPLNPEPDGVEADGEAVVELNSVLRGPPAYSGVAAAPLRP